jgi:hypothetical protein
MSADSSEKETVWDEFVRSSATADDPDRKRMRIAGLKRVLVELLSNPDATDINVRRLAAVQLTDMAGRVLESEESAGRKRSKAHTAQRIASGGGAVVAASSGSALAAGVSGPVATWVGIGVVVVALASAALGAVLPEAEYERNKRKNRRYEKLWWDIRTFATLTLPTVDPASIASRLEDLSAAIESAGDE